MYDSSFRIFFSVIVPLYNRERLIADTINSIAVQTYRNFEVIIVDDGSTDNSGNCAIELIAQLKLKGKVLRIANSGHGAARDYGIKHSSGNFIAPIDSDDLWLPDFLETMATAINAVDSEFGNQIFFTDFNMFFDDIGDVNKYETLQVLPRVPLIPISKKVYLLNVEPFGYLLKEQPIFWGTVCFSRQLYDKIGPISKYIPGKSGSPVEWEFFLRCAYSKVNLIYIKEVKAKIRRHAGNMSSELSTQLSGEIDILKLVTNTITLSNDKKTMIRDQIIERTFACGYAFFDGGDMICCRKCFGSILMTKYFLRSLYYLLLSYVPLSILNKLRS